MADISSISENGLLAELAYLKLENYSGKTEKELIDFIKENNEDTTGIEPERKQAMINLLNKYEIVSFQSNEGELGSGF